MSEFAVNLLAAVGRTFAAYLPGWILGVLTGMVLAYLAWAVPRSGAKALYYILTGFSFVPVTILIPFFLRSFGLTWFIHPLLTLPVALAAFAALNEAFQHANVHRRTLLLHYSMERREFFWRVIFRESMPAVHTAGRQTLALAFAIFLALDYFLEYWRGLGALAQHFYARTGFSDANWYKLLAVVAVAASVGATQTALLGRLMRPLLEFRKHF